MSGERPTQDEQERVFDGYENPRPVPLSVSAREKLLAVLPHIREAIEDALLDHPVAMLGIVGANPDGSGKLTATFDVSFLDDVETLLRPHTSREVEHAPPERLTVPTPEPYTDERPGIVPPAPVAGSGS